MTAPHRRTRAPRLVATDLDGTLLRPDGTVSAAHGRRAACAPPTPGSRSCS